MWVQVSHWLWELHGVALSKPSGPCQPTPLGNFPPITMTTLCSWIMSHPKSNASGRVRMGPALHKSPAGPINCTDKDKDTHFLWAQRKWAHRRSHGLPFSPFFLLFHSAPFSSFPICSVNHQAPVIPGHGAVYHSRAGTAGCLLGWPWNDPLSGSESRR